VDSRISALITAGTKAFLPLTQQGRGVANRNEFNFLGKQNCCLLDNLKPYQRPKLSDGGANGPEHAGEVEPAVRWSAWLGGAVVITVTPFPSSCVATATHE
jgi:hypothetical protein